MARAAAGSMLHFLRHVAEDQCADAMPDTELLRRFRAERDETAFRALMRRHAPMVLDVCRSALGNEVDAEDAFQATFLILARKAGSIRKSASVASWLHGVAYRTACKALAGRAKRRKHEAGVPPRSASETDGLTWREVQRVLHEELSKLSERYRAPLVLCYLQGMTQDGTAARLGVSEATVKKRLERGRALLRARLAGRGVGPAAVLMAFARPSSACVPDALANSTVKAAALSAGGQAVTSIVSATVAALAEGVMRQVFLTKMTAAAVLAFVIAVLGLGAGVLVWQSQAATVGAISLVGQKADEFGLKQREPVGIGGPSAKVVDRVVEQLKKNRPRQLPQGEDHLGLFLIDVLAGDVTLIVAAADAERTYCGSPCWSNDGRRILFDASPGRKFDKTRLQMLEVADQGVGLSSSGFGNCPTISPDGKHVAYLLNPGAIAGASSGIYVMKVDGSDSRRLGGYGIPKWSPDGRQLLIISFTSPCNLSLMNVDTAEERPIQIPGHQVYSVPSWSGDGTILAFVRSAKGFAVALVDVTNPAEAKIKEVLWKRGDGTNVEPMYPVYSASTRRGVFVGREQKGQALYAFEPGKVPRRLEPEGYDRKISSLALSPDGRYVLFCCDRAWPRLPATQDNQDEIIKKVPGKEEVFQ